MSNLFGPPSADRFHLSEDTLTRMMNQELSVPRRWLATRHLNQCRQCQVRQKSFERAALRVAEYSQNLIERRPLSSARRDLFIQSLDLLLESLPLSSWRCQRPVWRFGIGPFGNGVPSLGSALILVCIGLIVFSVWHSRLPTVSASELLTRALASDNSPAKIMGAGVICQRVRVETRKTTLVHSVYRDSSGSRRPRDVKAGKEEKGLEVRLALAGVNWDNPLSAVSFKNWHDAQPNATDQVHYSGAGLLTITTRLPLTNIAQESLTVRERDFHPTERIVEYRDASIVDISEVGFDLLSPEVAKQLFAEPAPVNSTASPRVALRAVLPSQAQMLETELQARLILNRQNADTGEQIAITRDAKGIQIQGLVDGDERKQQLKESLREIPFLSVSIKSFDELKSAASPSPPIEETKPLSTVARVSPLERYLVQQGRSRADLGRISVGLFHASLSINRSCHNLEQIRQLVSGNDDLTGAAISARSELLTRIIAQLIRDVKEQKELLDDSGMKTASVGIGSNNSEAGSADLLALAEENTKVTRELISGVGEPAKPAERLVEELVETILRLRTAAFQIHPEPKN